MNYMMLKKYDLKTVNTPDPENVNVERYFKVYLNLTNVSYLGRNALHRIQLVH